MAQVQRPSAVVGGCRAPRGLRRAQKRRAVSRWRPGQRSRSSCACCRAWEQPRSPRREARMFHQARRIDRGLCRREHNARTGRRHTCDRPGRSGDRPQVLSPRHSSRSGSHPVRAERRAVAADCKFRSAATHMGRPVASLTHRTLGPTGTHRPVLATVRAAPRHSRRARGADWLSDRDELTGPRSSASRQVATGPLKHESHSSPSPSWARRAIALRRPQREQRRFGRGAQTEQSGSPVSPRP